jgi:hypothetical protein
LNFSRFSLFFFSFYGLFAPLLAAAVQNAAVREKEEENAGHTRHSKTHSKQNKTKHENKIIIILCCKVLLPLLPITVTHYHTISS